MAGPKTLAGLTEDPEYAAPASVAQSQNPSRAHRKTQNISDQAACWLLYLLDKSKAGEMQQVTGNIYQVAGNRLTGERWKLTAWQVAGNRGHVSENKWQLDR